MKFAVAIEKDEKEYPKIITPVYGVTVPDIPGCYSWGDTIEQALENTKEAIVSHIETLKELGEPIEITALPLAKHSLNPEFSGATWHEVEVDLSKYGILPSRSAKIKIETDDSALAAALALLIGRALTDANFTNVKTKVVAMLSHKRVSGNFNKQNAIDEVTREDLNLNLSVRQPPTLEDLRYSVYPKDYDFLAAIEKKQLP